MRDCPRRSPTSGTKDRGTTFAAAATPGERPARVLLLGGTPFTEELVMWWNFVGRSHDDIVSYRQLWEDADERFGAVQGYQGCGHPAARPAAADHPAAAETDTGTEGNPE